MITQSFRIIRIEEEMVGAQNFGALTLNPTTATNTAALGFPGLGGIGAPSSLRISGLAITDIAGLNLDDVLTLTLAPATT